MSATGRNKTGKERDPLDYYPTPAATTRAILPFLDIGKRDIVFDPACGDGAILNEVRTWYGCETVGIELDEGRARVAASHGNRVVSGNAFTSPWLPPRDDHWSEQARFLIGNPPFGLSMEFIAISLNELHHRRLDRVVWLLPLDFVATKGRADFHRKHPSDMNVLTERPSFTGDGDTDMRQYAWFVWPGGGKWRVV